MPRLVEVGNLLPLQAKCIRRVVARWTPAAQHMGSALIDSDLGRHGTPAAFIPCTIFQYAVLFRVAAVADPPSHRIPVGA